MTHWETVIGLEVHVQLACATKIFSASPTAYGAEQNTQASALDLGMPGTLPVLNRCAVQLAARFGLAIGAKVARHSVFARKNYFYPDLPKGYQISQLELPIVVGGHLDISVHGESKRIAVTRAHLEEDAGKSLHQDFHGMTGIDLNRAGTPLLEIVSEPDMRSAVEAVAYMRKLHTLVRALGISDGNMQEGSFRCDANVSIRPQGERQLGTRTELKNINSFRFVEQAIGLEVSRQRAILEGGGQITQETRLFDPEAMETRAMRSKEEANDYRYFPDPDLLPVVISDEQIERWREALPELPDHRSARYQKRFGLGAEEADQIAGESDLAVYFEAMVEIVGSEHARICSNWLSGELAAALNKASLEIAESPVSATALAGLVARLLDGTISGKIAKQVFSALWEGETDADSVIESQGLRQISDSGAIEKMVDEVIARFPQQAGEYREGQLKMLQFFVGQVMRASKGQANPGQVNKLLKEKLN